MDLKKVFDQTVRELKREVNKKVLKVPEIEQKVLDATSNEPWGPHGTLMADIAQATRNYNDYQMIMGVLWKRVNDTGRNWRHVYKALTILEYLVAHGSERVIDELREHSYQVSTLTDFQYVESSGKDQGINVRKKAQALVGLVNDKERIREVRQKAVTNRDKYRGLSSTGGIYKPSSYSSTSGSYGGSGDRYDDDRYGSTGRYGNKDDDRYAYSRDKDFDRYRDEDRYGRDGDDRYSRDGERNRREDRYKDDYSGEHDQEERYGTKRGEMYDKFSSGDRDHDRQYDDDDDHYPSRSRGNQVEDNAQDDRRADRRSSVTRMPDPPSYEEAFGSVESGHRNADEHSFRDIADPPKATGPSAATAFPTASASNKSTGTNSQLDDFDDFDPRRSSVPTGDDLLGKAVDVAPSSNINALPSGNISGGSGSGSNLFDDSLFGSGFTSTPALLPSSLNNQPQLDGNLFGESAFKAEPPTAANFFTGTGFNASFVAGPSPVPPLSATGIGASGLNSFGSAPTEPITNPAFIDTQFFGGDSYVTNSTPPTGTTAGIAQLPAAKQVQQPYVPNQVQQSTNLGQVHQPSSQATTSSSGLKLQQKFETKSSVWADTLSKGLIDLNISGPKINPLAELGIDLDSGSLRQERKKEERVPTTTNMGKAMGSGSGLGLVGASVLNPPPGPMVGMGMGPLGMAPIGMGPNLGPGMGMGMMGAPMGMGNPGLGMRPPMGFGPNSGMGLGMNNSMLGMGFPGQQQYSGYR